MEKGENIFYLCGFSGGLKGGRDTKPAASLFIYLYFIIFSK